MSPDSTVKSLEVATVDGYTIELSLRGNGPPLLLIHGWTLDQRSFAPQFDALSKAMTVISYDRRGFGRSTAPPNLDTELEDIDAILGALQLQTVHMLGVSQGGRLALRYAVTRPDRLLSLILQGAPLDGFAVEESAEEQIPLAHFQALALDGKMDSLREQWLAHPLMSAGIEDPELAAGIANIVADYSGADLTAKTASPPRAMDVIGILPTLDCPTLVLSGALETASRRAHARKICALLPGSREVVMQHSGHLSNLTEPDAYNKSVLDFCLDVEANR